MDNLKERDNKILEERGLKVINWEKRYYGERRLLNVFIALFIIVAVILVFGLVSLEYNYEQKINEIDEEYRHLVVMTAIKYDLSATELAELITHESRIKS